MLLKYLNGHICFNQLRYSKYLLLIFIYFIFLFNKYSNFITFTNQIKKNKIYYINLILFYCDLGFTISFPFSDLLP